MLPSDRSRHIQNTIVHDSRHCSLNLQNIWENAINNCSLVYDYKKNRLECLKENN